MSMSSINSWTGVALWAVCGVFIRLILHFVLYKSSVPGGGIYLDWWANLLGCFSIGFINLLIKQTREDDPKRKMFFQSVSRGLCGSLTTFSAFAVFVGNELYELKVALVMNALLVTVFCDNFVSYGEHFLKYLQSNKVAFADVQNEHYIEEKNIKPSKFGIIFALHPLLLSSAIIALIFLSQVGEYRGLSFVLLMAIPGGTFVANMIGTALSAFVFYYVNDNTVDTAIHKFGVNLTFEGDILAAISIGLCGSLTTLSTFMAEIRNLGGMSSKGGVYFFVSLSTAVSVVCGVSFWFHESFIIE